MKVFSKITCLALLIIAMLQGKLSWADLWGSGDWRGVESASVLPLHSSRFGVEASFEEGPVLSDLKLGEKAWIPPRLRFSHSTGNGAEFGFQYDLYKKIQSVGEGGLKSGSGSPRFYQKFSWGVGEGSSLAGVTQGLWLGFKWPAANEPLEIDSGDFGLLYLLSGIHTAALGSLEWNLQTGPLILGDRLIADQQNHAWVTAIGCRLSDTQKVSSLALDWTRAANLSGAWYRFWDSEKGPFSRSTLGMSYQYQTRSMGGYFVRWTRRLIEVGTQQSVTLGWTWETRPSG